MRHLLFNVIVDYDPERELVKLYKPIGDDRYVPLEVALDNRLGSMLNLALACWVENKNNGVLFDGNTDRGTGQVSRCQP